MTWLNDLPDRLDVPEVDEQRREQHRDPGAQHHERQDDHRHLQPGEHRPDARDQREDRDHDEVQREVEQRQQNDRQRDDEAGKLDLAHEGLVVHHAAHGVHRRLGEEREEDDRGQQLRAVIVVVRAAAGADLRHHGKEHVQHQEQQQRPHQLPQIAERGSEEPQLPLHQSDVERQVPEPLPIAGDRAGPGDRASQRLVGNGVGLGRARLAEVPARSCRRASHVAVAGTRDV